MGVPCKLFRLLVALAIGILLGACGYSSDNAYSPVSTTPAGFYTGALVSDVSGHTTAVVALASDSGELRIFDVTSHLQYLGALSFADDTLKPALTGYVPAPGTLPGNSTVCAGTVQGSFQPGTNLTGSYSCGGDHGRFSLLYDVYDSLQSPGYNFPAIAVRGPVGNGDVLYLALDARGGITGNDSGGCTYTGSMSVINPLINVFSVTLTPSCGGAPAVALTGLASFGFVPDTANQVLYLAVSGGVAGSESLAAALPYQ